MAAGGERRLSIEQAAACGLPNEAEVLVVLQCKVLGSMQPTFMPGNSAISDWFRSLMAFWPDSLVVNLTKPYLQVQVPALSMSSTACTASSRCSMASPALSRCIVHSSTGKLESCLGSA